MAWPKAEASRYRRTDGGFEKLDEVWPAKQALFIDPGSLEADDSEYLLVTGSARGTSDGQRAQMPFWIRRKDAHLALGDEKPSGLGDDERWILVSVTQGTLLAYRGETPVFATLISPGRGGVSRQGVDPVQASTTPRGRYRIQYKYRAQTMSPDKDKPADERSFWISEVPAVQYFKIPFALHTAYWHEDFGDWMSGGCVNLSPADGKWLFDWTLPHLPKSWDGVWAGGQNGRGTTVVVAR